MAEEKEINFMDGIQGDEAAEALIDELAKADRKITVGEAFISIMETLTMLDTQSEMFVRLRNRVSEKFYDKLLGTLVINLSGAIISAGLDDDEKRKVWNGSILQKLAKAVTDAPYEICEVTKDNGKKVGNA